MKKRQLLCLILWCFSCHWTLAQSALVQLVHNSGDDQLQSIDIYLDDVLFWDDFQFRTATPFLEVSTASQVQWAIAPGGSISSEDALLLAPMTFVANGQYVMVINGLVSTTGYSPLQTLDVDVFDAAQLNANNATEIDVLFAHGCTDLPSVSFVDNTTDATINGTLYFGQFGPNYVAMSDANFLLNMNDISNNLIEQFEVNLADMGLAGSAAIAVLSGFNSPENNFLGPALGLWLALPYGGDLIECPIYVPPQYTQAQIINASADPFMNRVDIYVNDQLYIDDLEYLHATAFIDIQALIDLELLIAPDSSLSADEAFASLVVNLAVDQDYVLTIQGQVQQTGFYPQMPLDIQLFEGAISDGLAGSSTNILFVDASTDMPAMDLLETELLMVPFAENFAYDTHAGYFDVFTADYVFALADIEMGEILAAYSAPLSSYALGSNAVTIVAAGYLNPTSNQNGPGYGLYLALAGGGALIPLPVVQAPAQANVQFIHNSPDPLLEFIDVYINDALWIDDLPFRHASVFAQLPAMHENVITVVPGDALDLANGTQWTYDWVDNEHFILVLNGLLDGQNYSPNLPLSLMSVADATTTAGENEVAIRMINGSTDGPTFNVENANDGSTLNNDLSYGMAGNYWTMPNIDFVLDITNTTGDQIYASFGLPLAGWNLSGAAHTLLASGFYAPPNNNNGPAFGLWLASPSGGELLELPQEIIPTFEARAQFVHNAADIDLQTIDLYMNGALIADNWAFRAATPFMNVPAEVPVLLAIAPFDSNGPEDALVYSTQNFIANSTNYVIAKGNLAETGYNPMQPFDFTVFNDAREASLNTGQCDVIVYHGSTDTPGLDMSEITQPIPDFIENLMFDGLGGYLSFDQSGDYGLEISIAGTVPLGQYALPVNSNSLGGQSLLLFASGFLNPANNSYGANLAFYAALADGSTFPLQEYVKVKEHTDEAHIKVFPNPAVSVLSMQVELPSAQNLDLELIDINGKVVFLERSLQMGNSIAKSIDVSNLPEGYYFLRLKNRQLVETIGFGIIR